MRDKRKNVQRKQMIVKNAISIERDDKKKNKKAEVIFRTKLQNNKMKTILKGHRHKDFPYRAK